MLSSESMCSAGHALHTVKTQEASPASQSKLRKLPRVNNAKDFFPQEREKCQQRGSQPDPKAAAGPGLYTVKSRCSTGTSLQASPRRRDTVPHKGHNQSAPISVWTHCYWCFISIFQLHITGNHNMGWTPRVPGLPCSCCAPDGLTCAKGTEDPHAMEAWWWRHLCLCTDPWPYTKNDPNVKTLATRWLLIDMSPCFTQQRLEIVTFGLVGLILKKAGTAIQEEPALDIAAEIINYFSGDSLNAIFYIKLWARNSLFSVVLIFFSV